MRVVRSEPPVIETALPTIATIDDLCQLVTDYGARGEWLYVRHSRGPEADAAMEWVSTNHFNGSAESGLSVMELHDIVPRNVCERWEHGDRHFIAWQVAEYHHADDPAFHPYILTGTLLGKGSDGEPVVTAVTPVAYLDRRAVSEAIQDDAR